MRDLPAARWAADPYGRHELRFWDGAAWTAHVSDHGVTSHDLVPGVAAGQSAARADEETAAMPVMPAMAGGAAAGLGADDPTVAMPAVPAATSAPDDTRFLDADGAAGLGTLFGGPPVPPQATPVTTRPRTGLIAGVTGLAVVGLVAGIIGFSGLGGSDGVVPVAGAPTTSAPTLDPTPEVTEEPVDTETSYGGPTTSPADRTTTVRTSTPPPTSTTTTPKTTTKTTPKPTVTRTFPTTLPPEFRQYPSCRAMNRDYPHGVGLPGARDRTQGGGGGDRVRDFYVSRPLYFVNAGLDTDGDGIACEA